MTVTTAKDLDIKLTVAGNRRATFSSAENGEIGCLSRHRGQF
jgi:hypothetical protein